MTKILLLLTGGTIGSSENNGIIKTEQDKLNRLVELYRRQYGNDCIFDVKQPLNILSENLEIHHWEILINYILNTDISDYNGIIITHGSDTLSYSSAILSMCLCHLDIPVIITASNYPPNDKRSNAIINLRSAVIMIKEVKKGIFTVFKNDNDKDCSVYLPTRINEADRFFDRFSSPDGICCGTVSESGFQINSNSPKLDEIYQKRQPVIKNRLSLKNNIIMIRPYPSFDYNSVKFTANTKAVLHITYHSSTTKTNGENSSLSLLRRCNENGIDFYCASFKDRTSAMYETGHILLQNGAKRLFNISDESAYAKLLLCYNLDTENKDIFMENNIYFESWQ